MIMHVAVCNLLLPLFHPFVVLPKAGKEDDTNRDSPRFPGVLRCGASFPLEVGRRFYTFGLLVG